MFAVEVKYRNADKTGMLVALCEKSTDEVGTIMRNNRIQYTEIVSVSAPPIDVKPFINK